MTKDRVSALCFLAFSIAYGVMAYQIELFPGSEYETFTARTLPVGLAVAGTIVSILMIILPSPRQEAGSFSGRYWWRVVALCILMLVYGATITWLGFVVSTSFFLAIGFVLLGERRPLVIVGLALAVGFGFWALLTQLLGIYLEPGLLI